MRGFTIREGGSNTPRAKQAEREREGGEESEGGKVGG